MGFHPFDLFIVLAIGLLIFGPKSMQSLAHRAGKTARQANEMKDKLLAELPMDELSAVRENLSRIPTSPQQAALMLLTPEQEKKQKEQQAALKDEQETTVPPGEA